MLRLNLKKIIFEMCMAMPLLYSVAYMLHDDLANKVVIVELVLCYVLLSQTCLRKGKKILFVLFHCISVFYIFYTILIGGIAAVIHLNFYSYFFLMEMLFLFADKDIRGEFYTYFIGNARHFWWYSGLFAVAIFYSAVFEGGLSAGYGITLPVLFGPFPIAHITGYLLIALYCGIGLLDQNNTNKWVILVKAICVGCALWTAVRSTILAMALLVMYDYFSIKSFRKKYIILVAGVIVLIYAALFTDIIWNNPLIQKTIYAAEVNGSITNGREWYREAVMDSYWHDTSLIEKVFGFGIQGVIDAIYHHLGVRIHAHNDYVNVLGGFGAVGFIIFLAAQFYLGNIFKKNWTKLIFHSFIFVLAYYNGLAMYIMFVASLPMVLCFFEQKQRSKSVRQ